MSLSDSVLWLVHNKVRRVKSLTCIRLSAFDVACWIGVYVSFLNRIAKDAVDNCLVEVVGTAAHPREDSLVQLNLVPSAAPTEVAPCSAINLNNTIWQVLFDFALNVGSSSSSLVTRATVFICSSILLVGSDIYLCVIKLFTLSDYLGKESLGVSLYGSLCRGIETIKYVLALRCF